MNQLRPIFETGVVPCGVALVFLVLLWRPWRRTPEPPRYALPVAMCAGFIAGVLMMFEWRGLGWWPPDPTRRMAHYALIGLIASGILALLPAGGARWKAAARMGARLLVSGGVGVVLFLPLMKHTWATSVSIAAAGSLALAGTVWWSVIAMGATHRPGAGLLFALGVAAAGSAGLLVMSGNAALGQQAMMLGVVVIAGGLVALRCPSLVSTGGLGAVLGVLLAALWGAGLAYATKPIVPISAVLVGLSPLVAGLGLIRVVAAGPRWRLGAIQVGVAALLVGLGVGLMAAMAESESADSGIGISPDEGYWDSSPSDGSQ